MRSYQQDKSGELWCSMEEAGCEVWMTLLRSHVLFTAYWHWCDTSQQLITKSALDIFVSVLRLLRVRNIKAHSFVVNPPDNLLLFSNMGSFRHHLEYLLGLKEKLQRMEQLTWTFPFSRTAPLINFRGLSRVQCKIQENLEDVVRVHDYTELCIGLTVEVASISKCCISSCSV